MKTVFMTNCIAKLQQMNENDQIEPIYIRLKAINCATLLGQLGISRQRGSSSFVGPFMRVDTTSLPAERVQVSPRQCSLFFILHSFYLVQCFFGCPRDHNLIVARIILLNTSYIY